MPSRKPASTLADQSLTAVPIPEDLPIAARPDDNPNGGDPEGPTPAENPDEVEEDADADENNQDGDADADADDDAEKQAETPSELPAGQAPAGQPGPAAAPAAPAQAEVETRAAAAADQRHGASAAEAGAYSSQTVRYEARIQILDAYQYPGGLTGAPDWVDRNWVGYADPDDLRNIPAGPCLRVPLPIGLIAICRIGDYVCRQSVLLAPGLPADVRLEVWQREQFEKMFVPRQPLEFRPFNPPPLDPPAAAEPAKKPVKSSPRNSRAPARASRAA